MNSSQFKQWCKTSSQKEQTATKPLIMGILNITPDSFSDGGRYFPTEQAVEHALEMIQDGADIIDIGGESSRPGAVQVDVNEEIARVIPIIEQIHRQSDVCLSIDTVKPQVMRAAVAAGAQFINDIQALQLPDSLATAAELNVPVCIMHMQGTPQTMQLNPVYQDDIIAEINAFFAERINVCLAAGITRDNLILDPGFGYGKTVQDNLELIKQFEKFKVHGLPLLLGVSRKSTIGAILNQPVDKRMVGGLALNIVASIKGVSIIRTHDVAQTRDALMMLDAARQLGSQS